MSDAKQLSYMSLHEVFAERDPEKCWAAIERIYGEDVPFIDPAGEVVGRPALNDARKRSTMPRTSSWRRTAWPTQVPTPLRSPGASGRRAARLSEGSPSSRSVMEA